MPEKNLTQELKELLHQLSTKEGLTPANIAKLGQFQQSNPNFIPSGYLATQLDGLKETWRNDPKFKDMMAQMQRKQKSDKIAAQAAPIMQAVLAGTDIATAFNQVKSAKRAGLGLRRPMRPNFRPSRELQTAVDEARARTNQIDPNVTNHLKLENLDSYIADLQNAKTASGGQAGLYGSLAQSAINRRNRNTLASAPIMQQMLQQNRSRYDNLLAQQQAEQARMNQLDLGMYGQDMNQYNNEARAIGALEATGRSNTRNSLYNMGQLAPNLIGNLATMNPQFKMPSWARRESLKDWYEGSDVYNMQTTPRYTPDVNELGPENAPYLGALQASTEWNMNSDSPMPWTYKPTGKI